MDKWLRPFRQATDAMSQSKVPTISVAYAHFIMLQNTLRRAYGELPTDSAADRLKSAISQAHVKLSEYVGLFAESKYFFWASCKLYPPDRTLN